MIPLAAGGAVDTMVRTMMDSMRSSLGQPILVENMGGAGGVTGITRVARAAPDGYTVSVGTWGTHVVNAFVYSPPYDLGKDFEPVALLPSVPHWFIARKNLPPTNLRELIAYMKDNAGKVTAGSVGAGGSSAICSYYFGKVTGTTRRWCHIAAARRRCRTSSPAMSTPCAIWRPIRWRRSRPATSRPMR